MNHSVYSNTEIVRDPVETIQVASNLSVLILKILHKGHLKFTLVSLADPRGVLGTRPSLRFKILSFACIFDKKLQNNGLAHPLWELVPPPENPGSATECHLLQLYLCICQSVHPNYMD